ncbi:MAG: hypothetical protein JKY48_10270, partial [Flavobacteriales bacterium]|nr:hypothetical protein [Flavobacteriales bacterium]
MNWNIQNFGEKRSKGTTVVELIAYQVAKLDVDILVLIELNTSKPDVAIKILKERLIPRIEKQYEKIHNAQQKFRFTISAQSAFKGAESYAYIYKDTIQAC